MPLAYRPPFALDDEPGEERHAWRNLLRSVDNDFYNSEVSLADLINNLYDYLAPYARRIGPTEVGARFHERGISVEGKTYILMDDPGNFAAGINIIAVVPDDRVIDLG